MNLLQNAKGMYKQVEGKMESSWTKQEVYEVKKDWLAGGECFPRDSASGRTALLFSEKERRAKFKATEHLRNSHSREELVVFS